MDLTGNYPKLLDSDPLSEMAEYTQIMADTLGNVVAGSLTLGSLYQAYGATFGTPSYTRDSNDIVVLAGLIGTNQTTLTMTANTQYLIGTLPLGVRPINDRLYTPPTSSAMTGKPSLFIRANGDIHFETTVGFTSLAKASFFIGVDGFAWKAA